MKLSFREYGNSGTPVVILHGLYGSSDNWAGIARALSDQFRVIVPDMRNHGKSPHTTDHSYNAMSEDILELVDSLEIGKFIIAGHSMGGKAAIWFASRWPERVAGLIVLDMSPFRADPDKNQSLGMHLDILRMMNETDLSSIGGREEADRVFSKTIKSDRIRSFLLKNLTRNEKGGFKWKLNPANLALNLDNIMDGIPRRELADMAIRGFPVLFLRAENSGYINDDEIDDIMKLFPAAEIIMVKNTSHWLHAEEPELITGYIRDFAS